MNLHSTPISVPYLDQNLSHSIQVQGYAQPETHAVGPIRTHAATGDPHVEVVQVVNPGFSVEAAWGQYRRAVDPCLDDDREHVVSSAISVP